MAGYKGYSMSNNAVYAYENGEKPLSKWTKTDIVDAINKMVKEEELVLGCSKTKLNKLPVKLMKKVCLTRTSWHHTSSRFNETDFYSIDAEYIEELTDEKIENEIKRFKEEEQVEKAKKEVEEIWECCFLEWSGTRKHPKATEMKEIGVIKGNWFFREDGSKKSINANGFAKLRKVNK